MKRFGCVFLKFSALFATFFVGGFVYADQAPNPRSAVSAPTVARAEGRVSKRSVVGGQNISRGLIGRSGANMSGARSASNVASAPVARGAVRQNSVARSGAKVSGARSGAVVKTNASVARSAVAPVTGGRARSATNVSNAGMARVARATAVFTDVSKIGGGYAQCRESYATCMDQFCANANDTYRRCFCSAKFTEFRDTEEALDQAKVLLQQFEDNNLNAVDKTAAEVEAMYSATIGEQAIKKDTSGAQNILNEIGDLLSGKKKATQPEQQNNGLSGLMSVDFSADVDDIWGGDSGSSIFDADTGVDMSVMEGIDLYNISNKQCLQLVGDACENSAVLNMATSAYNIMITQDCNAYEKKINKQREAVLTTVRQAEKFLREARLEEYRAHNSADVNECITKVKAALTTDVACGPNYNRCLDYSGAYINSTTGEPIYSRRLFELENLIVLGGADASTDLLAQNPKFSQFLDEKRMFATSALDSCRGIADVVWTEFKRSALIEIAQAQDEKIEEVKTTCVSTMAQCYDTQSSALKDFDTTTAKNAGALSAYAAKAMCQEKVTACAALYGDTDGCSFDGNGKLQKSSAGKRCGLAALLNFVDSVDNTRVAEGCADAVEKYVTDLCTPATGDKGYPWNCRLKNVGAENNNPDASHNASLWSNVKYFAVTNCADPTQGEQSYSNLPQQVRLTVEKSIRDVVDQVDYMLDEECEALDGYWLDAQATDGTLLTAFYSNVFGGRQNEAETSWGRCVQNTTKIRCEQYNETAETDEPLATYDLARDECKFSAKWYEQQCTLMGNGYYENGVCYVAPDSGD